MKITNDKPAGRSASKSRYDDIFTKLTQEKNCIAGLTDAKDCNKVAHALENWAKKNIGQGCRVTTCGKYPTDQKPRIWLWWPMQPNTKAEPVTAIRGPWPKGK